MPTAAFRGSGERGDAGAVLYQRFTTLQNDLKGDGLRAVLLAVGGVAAVDLQRMLGCSGGCVPSPLPRLPSPGPITALRGDRRVNPSSCAVQRWAG